MPHSLEDSRSLAPDDLDIPRQVAIAMNSQPQLSGARARARPFGQLIRPNDELVLRVDHVRRMSRVSTCVSRRQGTVNHLRKRQGSLYPVELDVRPGWCESLERKISCEDPPITGWNDDQVGLSSPRCISHKHVEAVRIWVLSDSAST